MGLPCGPVDAVTMGSASSGNRASHTVVPAASCHGTVATSAGVACSAPGVDSFLLTRAYLVGMKARHQPGPGVKRSVKRTDRILGSTSTPADGPRSRTPPSYFPRGHSQPTAPRGRSHHS
jgi:hypothetical protein